MAQPADLKSLLENVQEIEVDTVLPTYVLASTVGVRAKKQRALQRHERARLGGDRLPLSGATIAALLAAGVKLRVKMLPMRGLCGAKTRRGHACRCLALKSGRCRLHGGLSTGPKTTDGWARTRAGYAAWVNRKRQLAPDSSGTTRVPDEKS
ncbi:hypothetical protein GCM10009101_11400 [Brevundimonas lenta]